MPAAHFGGDFVGAGGGADTWIFVGGDGHPDTGSADEDSAVSGTFGDALGDLASEVGVIDGLVGVGTTVDGEVAFCLQFLEDFGFHQVSSVIASDGDSHGRGSFVFWFEGRSVDRLRIPDSELRRIQFFDPGEENLLELIGAELIGIDALAERVGDIDSVAA